MSTLTELLRGRGAHADPVALLEDLPAAVASRHVPGLPHSIWQLVSHLNYWMELELKCIEGPAASHPGREAQDWPAGDPPPDEVAWRHEVALFRLNLEQLTTLAEARASTLARIVHRTGENRTDTVETVETVLWQLVAHNSYHAGQITDLRRALGAWPPAEAGG